MSCNVNKIVQYEPEIWSLISGAGFIFNYNSVKK